MTPDVRAKLASLYGSADDAPVNLARVLNRRPDLLDGIPGKAPHRWRQLSEPSLEHALAINLLLLGPDGAFTALIMDEAATRGNPAPHKTIIGDLFAGMGRVLKGTAATISKTVTSGQSLVRTLTAARLKSQARDLAEKRKLREAEIGLEKELSRTERARILHPGKAEAGSSSSSALTTTNPVSFAARENPVKGVMGAICDLQEGNRNVLRESRNRIIKIRDGDFVGVVGRLQWLMLLRRSEKSTTPDTLQFMGFTPLWRDSEKMLDAFGKVVADAQRSKRNWERAFEGPDLWVAPDCTSFFFRAQFSDRGIVDNPDRNWPVKAEDRREHLTAIIDTFNANDPPWLDRDLVVRFAQGHEHLFSPGVLVAVCYQSDRDGEPQGVPYVHGFNPVFEGNDIIHKAADTVVRGASPQQYAACLKGPRLAVHEDGQLFLFNARLTRDGIHEDGEA
jgi:hypothetical protein